MHGVEGVVTLGFNHTPAPSISPLEFNYQEQISNICERLNKGFMPGAVTKTRAVCLSFSDMAGLADTFIEITQKLKEADGGDGYELG
jgi:hypothetical protein